MSGPGDRIRIRYDEIEDVSRHFGTLSDDVTARMNSLRRQLHVLESGAWIGAGAARFYDEMDLVILPAVQRLAEALHASSEVLHIASQQFREADEGTSRLFMEFQSGELTDSGQIGFLERLSEIARARYNLGDAIGMINNALGVVGSTLGIPKAVKALLKLIESGYGAENSGQLLEQLAEGGVELVIDRGIAGLPSLVNDANQLLGKVTSGFAFFINGFHADPALSDAITHFDTTLENADLGSVTGSLATVVIDVGQINLAGYTRNPVLSRLLSIGGPGLPLVYGAITNPALVTELQHNSLTFVGSVLDFGAGATQMHQSYADLGANTARVISHSVGEFAGFPSALNDRFSTFVGDSVRTSVGLSSGLAGPGADLANRLFEHAGIPTPMTPDFSTWLGSLVPN